MRRLGYSSGLLGLLLFAATAAGSVGRDGVVLDQRTRWRRHKTWRTEAVRLESGKLARVDPWNPRQRLGESRRKAEYVLRLTQDVTGTAYPSADWAAPTFDDRYWDHQGGIAVEQYQALALTCFRGRFEVIDPARAGDLTLSVRFHGGGVVTVNGKEVARAHMPAGPIRPDTLANDYPLEAHVTPAGDALHLGAWNRPKKHLERHALRERRIENVRIPSALLVKGVNVLAVAIHRAPAPPAMFVTYRKGNRFEAMDNRSTYWWNRCALLGIRLSAKPGAPIRPNIARPDGFRLWNHTALEQVNAANYGDPAEPLRPVTLRGARNGVYAGQVVASSSKPIHRLRATATALRGPGGAVIGPDAIGVRYPLEYAIQQRKLIIFDALADRPPDGKLTRPIWLTVRIPKDARPGRYDGRLTVSAEGEAPIPVPIELDVFDWTLVDPQDFKTHAGFVQSPESLAMKYKVPMWSDAHWRLVDRSFALLAEAGNTTIYLPLIRQTHFGNPHSMVRYVRRPDGTWRPDFSIARRYVQTAVRHLRRLELASLYLWEVDSNPTGRVPADVAADPRRGQPPITQIDPATGVLTETYAPKWGTPAARTFWKPVIDGLRELLREAGQAKAMMFGLAGDRPPDEVVLTDLKAIVPDVPWSSHSHFFREKLGYKPESEQRIAYMATVGGCIGVFWNAGDQRPFYGWRNPSLVVVYARDGGGPGVPLHQRGGYASCRLFAEGSLISGRLYSVRWGPRKDVVSLGGLRSFEKFPGLRGVGRIGADFWPLLGPGRRNTVLAGRYPRTAWGTLSLATGHVTHAVLAPGPEGPTSTVRFELMRESLQEAEARIFVQDALTLPHLRRRLPDALARRLDDEMAQRTWAFRHVSECYRYKPWAYRYLLSPQWELRSAALYKAAAEVNAALTRHTRAAGGPVRQGP